MKAFWVLVILLSWPVMAADGLEIAITFDDLPYSQYRFSIKTLQEINRKQLDALKRHEVPGLALVNEKKLYVKGEVDARIQLLRDWLDAGHELGNHTYSHPSLYATSLDSFKENVVRGETVTRFLLDEKKMPLRYFRHPYLRTGGDKAKRDGFESWLKQRGYTVAPVTIENADYLFASIYSFAARKGDEETKKDIIEAYLAYTKKMFDFLEQAARDLFGRDIRHVLLLHNNELNADSFDALAVFMKQRGYRFITLERALEDEAYQSKDIYVGRAGVHWLFRWDHARGRNLDWRKEPTPPEYIQAMYEARGDYQKIKRP